MFMVLIMHSVPSELEEAVTIQPTLQLSFGQHVVLVCRYMVENLEQAALALVAVDKLALVEVEDGGEACEGHVYDDLVYGDHVYGVVEESVGVLVVAERWELEVLRLELEMEEEMGMEDKGNLVDSKPLGLMELARSEDSVVARSLVELARAEDLLVARLLVVIAQVED